MFQPLPFIITQPEAAFSLAPVQHFLSPMSGHLPFSRPLSITIIAIIATTPPHQRPHQSRSHPGELSHGTKALILMLATTTTRGRRTGLAQLSVISCFQRVTPRFCAGQRPKKLLPKSDAACVWDSSPTCEEDEEDEEGVNGIWTSGTPKGT